MNFLGFIFFSTLENIAFYIFILVLFRFNIKENIFKFFLFSIVQSFVSNSLQVESLQAVSALVQAILVIFFVAFFLRVHIFNAMVVVVTGYAINFSVQWTIITATVHFSETTVEPGTPTAFMVQTISATLMLIFSLITHLQKGGFSFIDHESRSKRSKVFVKQNRPLIILVTLSILLTFIANLLLLTNDTPYLLVAIVLFIALIGLLYICVKRDEREDG